MTQSTRSPTETEAPLDTIGAFLDECRVFCKRKGIGLRRLSQKSLQQTYALENLAARQERVAEQMAKVRAAMAEMDGANTAPPK